jgi:hypothetical protein
VIKHTRIILSARWTPSARSALGSSPPTPPPPPLPCPGLGPRQHAFTSFPGNESGRSVATGPISPNAQDRSTPGLLASAGYLFPPPATDDCRPLPLRSRQGLSRIIRVSARIPLRAPHEEWKGFGNWAAARTSSATATFPGPGPLKMPGRRLARLTGQLSSPPPELPLARIIFPACTPRLIRF